MSFAVRSAKTVVTIEENNMPRCKKSVNNVWTRLGWMVFIYLGSVAALAILATLFKLFMAAAGLRSH